MLIAVGMAPSMNARGPGVDQEVLALFRSLGHELLHIGRAMSFSGATLMAFCRNEGGIFLPSFSVYSTLISLPS